MYYIVQENLFNESGYGRLVQALNSLQLEHEFIKLIPFVDDIDVSTKRNDVFVFGAIKLARISRNYGWVPGSLMTDNHDYSVYSKYYGEHLLNFDSLVLNANDLWEWDGPKFIRPCKDSKDFNGQVFFKEEDWIKDRDLLFHNGFLKPETQIQVASPKNVYREFRFWIVDGKIATASQYKLGKYVVHSDLIDEEAIEFCKRMIDIFQLAKAFIIDVALTDNGCKIVECGCINCAGFYNADIQKLLIALEQTEW